MKLLLIFKILIFVSFCVKAYANDADAEAANNCRPLFPEFSQSLDCKMQNPDGVAVAVIGDSHAGHLYKGLSESLQKNIGVATFALSCAAPFIDTATGTREPNTENIRKDLFKAMNGIYDYVLKDKGIRYVVLAHNPNCSYRDAIDKRNLEMKDSERALKNGMIRTLKALKIANKKVLVLLDNPILPYDPKLCIKRPFRITSNDEDKCQFPREQFDVQQSNISYKKLITEMIKGYSNVSILDLSNVFCDSSYCHLMKNNNLLYLDQGHLNDNGSRYVSPYILNSLGIVN